MLSLGEPMDSQKSEAPEKEVPVFSSQVPPPKRGLAGPRAPEEAFLTQRLLAAPEPSLEPRRLRRLGAKARLHAESAAVCNLQARRGGRDGASRRER